MTATPRVCPYSSGQYLAPSQPPTLTHVELRHHAAASLTGPELEPGRVAHVEESHRAMNATGIGSRIPDEMLRSRSLLRQELSDRIGPAPRATLARIHLHRGWPAADRVADGVLAHLRHWSNIGTMWSLATKLPAGRPGGAARRIWPDRVIRDAGTRAHDHSAIGDPKRGARTRCLSSARSSVVAA
jgi:hypothetical protein